MYDRTESARQPRPRRIEGPPTVAPEARTEHAIRAIRNLLSSTDADLRQEPRLFLEPLQSTLGHPQQNAERLLCLGWVQWLNEDLASAETNLRDAAQRLTEPEDQALANYWLARGRLLLGRDDVIASFEEILRASKGSPQVTCWFVDLLGRAGELARAEQVWKAVRINPRVRECAESGLLEARHLIQQKELKQAKQHLLDQMPGFGPLLIEHRLLLIWIRLQLGETTEASEALDSILTTKVYPKSALLAWRDLHLVRSSALVDESSEIQIPRIPRLAAWIQAQQFRKADEPGQMSELLKSLSPAANLEPFLRYVKATVGEDDFADLLSAHPGPFLAIRCRLWMTLQRFCQRQLSPGDLQSVMKQAHAAGHRALHLEHWGILDDAGTDAETLWTHAGNPDLSQECRLNYLRIAIERLIERSTSHDALVTLIRWSTHPAHHADPLKDFLSRQMLRLLLIEEKANLSPADETMLNQVKETIEDNSLPGLAQLILDPKAPRPQTLAGDSHAAKLWCLAQQLRETETDVSQWRTEVESLPESTGPSLPLALLIHEAARCNDCDRVLDLLPKTANWHGSPTGAPQFLITALRSARPTNAPRWRAVVSEWLKKCPESRLSAEARALAEEVGLLLPAPESAVCPEGVNEAHWCLHQMSKSWSQQKVRDSVVWALRAEKMADQLSERERERLTAGLVQMRRLMLADVLAQIAQVHPSHEKTSPELLVDFAEQLQDHPRGQEILQFAQNGEVQSARDMLMSLTQESTLPERLWHHLALSWQRVALAFEAQAQMQEAIQHWRLSWNCWLHWLLTQNEGVRATFLGHLLEQHRGQIKTLLSRDQVDAARRYWQMIQELPNGVDAESELATTLKERLSRFREEMALDYLLATREVMRSGDIPEGWRCNYEAGTLYLRKLLSLDRDNRRLLIALVEICTDWFLDLYDTQDASRLREQVDRFTPFAKQLERMVADEETPDEEKVTARSVLSEMWKFRGFVAADYAEKISLYRAALELNPANENVQRLLTDLEDRQ